MAKLNICVTSQERAMDFAVDRGTGPTQNSGASHPWAMDSIKERIKISAKRFQTRSSRKWRQFITRATELSRCIQESFGPKEPAKPLSHWTDDRQQKIPAELVSGAVMYMKRTTDDRECLSALPTERSETRDMMLQGPEADTIQVQPITQEINTDFSKCLSARRRCITELPTEGGVTELSALPAATALDTERACLSAQKGRSETIAGDERGVARDATSPNPRGQREQLEDISAELYSGRANLVTNTMASKAIAGDASNQQPQQHIKGSRRSLVVDTNTCLERQGIGVT